jgi:hypothetical protein
MRLTIEDNTVSSQNQVSETDKFKPYLTEGSTRKIAIVGNSITLHGISPTIGWNIECGMAASSEENDYVHVLEKKVLERRPDASFCVCQVALWERSYKSVSEDTLKIYESARNFEPDIIVLRLCENCPKVDVDGDAFRRELLRLTEFLDGGKKAKLIITTAFWHHPLDSDIVKFAEENGIPLVELGDLGEMPEMKAIGLFEHSGVANHPGDLGMKTIAERIFEPLRELL